MVNGEAPAKVDGGNPDDDIGFVDTGTRFPAGEDHLLAADIRFPAGDDHVPGSDTRLVVAGDHFPDAGSRTTAMHGGFAGSAIRFPAATSHHAAS